MPTNYRTAPTFHASHLSMCSSTEPGKVGDPPPTLLLDDDPVYVGK